MNSKHLYFDFDIFVTNYCTKLRWYFWLVPLSDDYFEAIASFALNDCTLCAISKNMQCLLQLDYLVRLNLFLIAVFAPGLDIKLMIIFVWYKIVKIKRFLSLLLYVSQFRGEIEKPNKQSAFKLIGAMTIPISFTLWFAQKLKYSI